MSDILLSILIPTINGRENNFNNIFSKIYPFLRQSQKDGIYEKEHYMWYAGEIDRSLNEKLPYNIEIISLKDDKGVTIGEKREELYKRATGKFSLQIDDDDDISDNAIELILNTIKENPNVDCISFEERVTLDGKEYKSNFSHQYPCWEGDGQKELSDGFHFHRTIFYKCVIKTEIAKSVPFVHCRWGEDNLFANDLKNHIRTEIHIPEQIYYYNYISSPHNERYGIK